MAEDLCRGGRWSWTSPLRRHLQRGAEGTVTPLSRVGTAVAHNGKKGWNTPKKPAGT